MLFEPDHKLLVAKPRPLQFGFEEPPRPPDVHIYTRSKLPWIALPPEVPAFEAYYDSKTLWPAESLARRRALFG